MKATVLVVDDEAGVRTALTGVLEEHYEVHAVESGEACLKWLDNKHCDVIILDVWLPGMDGFETLARVRDLGLSAQVIVMSGHHNIESVVRAIKMGAFDFVEKPLSLEKIVQLVGDALSQQLTENRTLRTKLGR